ncbi:MAG TPA: sodium:proton antiporter [Deltaproteobacteria bacterium]|nr:sodium:proton antiporter [Deltaproteobacteria bacterium]
MQNVQLYWLIPFGLLLLTIALFPLLFSHFWEKNRFKALITTLISLPVFVLLFKNYPHELAHTTHEYISFLVLLGSLFTVSGGIHLSGDIQATPKINTLFLATGAVLANFVGTTGASMLLIRPMLQTNSERKNTRHIPLFFIFLVSNIGGMLTPIGDPPLFLGYLRGVPFLWTLHLLPIWLVSVGCLLALFYWWDGKAYQKEKFEDFKKDITLITPLKIHGAFNSLFLAGIVGAVFLPSPFRELVMVGLAITSYFFTSETVHTKNKFVFGPIIEVAILFAGIFITMVPALAYLEHHGAQFGITQPFQFYWITGVLSSFLDNAPTYLTFLSLAQGLHLEGASIVGVTPSILKAISAGAVMMGANSYIGNGPNFMVKAIADEAGFKTPSFFGYMAYSGGILIPLFILITLLFFI